MLWWAHHRGSLMLPGCARRRSCARCRTYPLVSLFFFFNDTATTEIYTLSLHDALPISAAHPTGSPDCAGSAGGPRPWSLGRPAAQSAPATLRATGRMATVEESR